VKNIINYALVRKTVHWLLTVVVILFIITGFGITEFRTVESLTFGLLTKSAAFKIHINLWIPFVILLALHVFFLSRLWSFLKSRKRRNKAVSD